MKQIPLTGGYGKGKYALVDDDMFDYLNQWNWYLAHGYPVRSKHKKQWGMHREIMGNRQGFVIDHADGDLLNNSRSNLRFATHQENHRNQRTPNHNTSGYKGVSWLERNQRWIVWISIEGRNRYFGSFKLKEDAVHVYDQVAIQLFGDFARPNFIDVCPTLITQPSY